MLVRVLSCVFIQVGSLASSGNGTPCTAPAGASKRALKKARSANNAAVLARLREDENSAELKELGEKDANHNRMSKWKIASLLELRACSVSSRFGVEQGRRFAFTSHVRVLSILHWSGLKPNGDPKIRVVDDMSRSGINGATTPAEHPLCDTIDTLHAGMRALRASLPKNVRQLFINLTCMYLCALQVAERAVRTFKANIDAAFRRISIMPSAPAFQNLLCHYVPAPPRLLASTLCLRS